MRHKLLFILLAAGLLFSWGWFYQDSLAHMVTVWSNSKTYEHCFLVLPIALWLAYQQRDEVLTSQIQPSPLFASFIVAPALLWIVGKLFSIAFFEHVAAIVALQVVVITLLGKQISQRLWFPIFFLLFAVPFGEELIPYLQQVTADLAITLLHISNVPAYRDDLYIYIPTGTFFVAEACSGIRFLISTVTLGFIIAYLQFSSWWGRLSFIALATLVPIIANGIRAWGIVYLGYISDMKVAAGADHLVYGWVFFSIVTLIVVFAGIVFGRKRSSFHYHDNSKKTASTASASVYLLSLSLFLSLQFVAAFGYQQWLQSNADTVQSTLPVASQWLSNVWHHLTYQGQP
uniref:exosortase A n=1 Tax=Thaumasiovibrio occultus TaxID=1891184 RepID=UPI000B35F5F0|nr:exosortase A [Thaumasiovibrio occultus]